MAKHSAQTTLDRHNNGIGATIQADPAAAVHTAGAAAKIVTATPASAVTAEQSQPDATGTSAAQQTELPQTNEHTSAGWAILGLLLGSLGVTGFRKRRHE
ncbi:MAG: LPXTG cell wall anchor domain-containing protein [Levilactobacillus sp.]|nr:LPXTG cell wall anchor domain-containing protein [Levilactobacillus sp.]MCI1554568.1 LPXTG cell wall anchor domain-containing protein [Levilactobacillus sp.]